MTNIVEMCVHMDCAGCESRIKKALHRLKGVEEVEVDMAAQKVTVTGWADQKKVLKAVRKTGRRAVLWPYGAGVLHPQPPVQLAYSQHQPAAAAAAQHYFHHHPALGPAAPSSSYNYYKHGYDTFHAGAGVGYYPYRREGATSMFSDDNPHACSIM